MITNLADIKDKHLGETIYIIGNGTHLGKLKNDEIQTINDGISIGTNASHLAFPKTTYFSTGHFVHLLFNLSFGDCECRFFQGQPFLDNETRNQNKICQITQQNVKTTHDNLTRNVTNETWIIGAEQIGFAATHLAVLMGAAKIVYLGFDHRSANHYYSFPPYNTLIRKQIQELREKYASDNFANGDIDDFININIDPMSLPEAYHPNGKEPLFLTEYDLTLSKFKSVFEQAKQYGVEIQCIEEDSIVADAGATVIKL